MSYDPHDLDPLYVREKTLETERLVLRPCTLADADAVPPHRLPGNIAVHQRLGFGCMVVQLKETGAKIGRVGLQIKMTEEAVIDADARPYGIYDAWGAWTELPVDGLQQRNGARQAEALNAPDVDIYWFFDEAHWGRGYATEAARCLIRYGFEKLRLRRITAANIFADNEGSIRLAERVGMTVAPMVYEPSRMTAIIEHPDIA